MIALTQEKREELVERYLQQIETFKYHLSQIGTDHFDGEAYSEILLKTEIALASLTTAAVLHAVDSDVEDKIYTALCNEHEVGAYPLFTAPPVPEITLPEKLPCDVSVTPNVVFRKGVNTQTLLNCLIRKNSDLNEAVD